ncbi:MAG TPA: nucleoside/nucleotide kinase family protein [Propionibacteriaceae bacterium]|nr:nucleoside/nucleotide kinase family protein [Propionibacteriaceae bacterium]
MSLDELVDAACALAPGSGRAILGVAGVPGAGKSTLAELLVDAIGRERGVGWVAHVPMDGFHLADVQLERLGVRQRKGAPETFDPAGYAALLRRLRTETDRPVYAPGFERTLEQPIAGAMVVEPAARLVVTEGNYLLLDRPEWRAVRDQIDEVWYVDGGDDVRMERLVARHVAFGKTPEEAAAWVERVDVANGRLIEASRDRADLHVDVSAWSPPT